MGQNPSTSRFRSWFFQQKPLSDRRYIVLLVCGAVLVPLLALNIYIGTSWLYVLGQLMVVVSVSVTLYRERQRRMRIRAARLQRH